MYDESLKSIKVLKISIHFLVGILLSFSGFTASSKTCKSIFETHPLFELLNQPQKPFNFSDIEKRQESWKPTNLSYPLTEKLPGKFRFFVHTINLHMHSNSRLTYRAALEHLDTSPSKRDFISLSLIDEKHSDVYGVPIGFIVKVNEKNILAAAPEDMRSTKPLDLEGYFPFPMNESDKSQYLYKKYSLPPPEDILSSSKPDRYNEVLVVRNSGEENPLVVLGLFIQKGTAVPRELIELAQQENLPILEIP